MVARRCGQLQQTVVPGRRVVINGGDYGVRTRIGGVDDMTAAGDTGEEPFRRPFVRDRYAVRG